MDRIEEIRERERNATPGPWEPDLDVSDPDVPEIEANILNDGLTVFFISGTDLRCHEQEDWKRARESRAYKDAEFIAHAREDIPYLLERIDELKREVERLRGLKS
jgi:hypothetical protein